MLHHLYILVAGIVFGLANVIPGVSGGTMTVDAASGAVTMGGEMVEDGLEGDWPVLQPGANAVSWSGSVTAVSITVNPFDIGA